MDFEKMKNAMAELDEDTLLECANQVMTDGGSSAMEALDACRLGMEEVGKLFDEGEYFVGDLVFAGEIMTETIEILKPGLKADGDGANARMIIATVKDDLHDLGKNIVKALLSAAGFDVLDMGVDAAPEAIVEKARQEGISIVALSGVLTFALESMKKTVKAFEDAGLRDQVHIIIGGAPVSEDACRNIGADECAISPMKTVDTCRAWAKS